MTSKTKSLDEDEETTCNLDNVGLRSLWVLVWDRIYPYAIADNVNGVVR